MKSIASISSSVKAVLQYSPNALVSSRGLMLCNTHLLARLFNVETLHKSTVAPPCISTLRSLHTTRERGAAAQQFSNLSLTEEKDDELMLHLERCLLPKTTLGTVDTQSIYPMSSSKNLSIKDPPTVKSLFEAEILPELCARLTDAPSDERIELLATSLGVCQELSVDPNSPLISRLKEECMALLSRTDIELPHLCHLGEVAYKLEGSRSEVVAQVLNSVSTSINKALNPNNAAQVYSLLVLCQDSHQCQAVMPILHRQTERLVHRLKAGNISDILHSLGVLQQNQAISLILKLSRRSSRLFKDFTDQELLRVLASLMQIGHHDQEFLAAMEKYLPSRIAYCDAEIISTVMEYCLQMRCRSEPMFEAVAEGFVNNAERYSTHQIGRQIVAMGRLNYLPKCSSQMFKMLESVLQSRFSQFQPRSVIEMLHSCIHLERFPLNFVSRVFSPYFLQRLQAQGEPLDKSSLGQLTQLNLATSLECTYYRGPRLPYSYHVKKFSSLDQYFETPMDRFLYNRVKSPLRTILGGKTYYSTRVFTQTGYTIDVEINLDEDGFVLPLTQWDHTYKKIALCLDGQNRFCSNTQHLLGKEATKRRHLRRLGYDVVQIPYYEFERLRRQEDQLHYLQKKIFPTIFKFSH